MHSHYPQKSILSKSLPPTPSQLEVAAQEDNVPDDYFGEPEDIPLPFPIQTIVADPHSGLSLTLISALGAGSYAVVYLAREVASGSLYALKCLGKDKLTEDELAVQRNEVVIHTSLPKHKNIVHLFNMFETTNHLFLLLEYSSGMDMYQWISNCSDKSDPNTGEPYSISTRYSLIKSIFDQVLEAVGLVHSYGIAHRDLKPENFLIELADGQYAVKLTDFGLATMDSESDEFECGSKPYMSFECRNGLDDVYDVKMADIWSLGIILINLLYRRCPWSDPCPQDSYNFTEFLKSRVDFLQRRFEDMPGPVARWLGLRAFAFVGSRKFKHWRPRPSMDEWKSWMMDFVPRMLGQTDSSSEIDDDDYNDAEEYREYLRNYEGEEVFEDCDDDDDDDDDDNQVVPINIQSSSYNPKKISHLDVGQPYASYHASTNTRLQNSFKSSSVPKFDPSAFYQPTRLRQESWSDAMDMGDTEDAEMDFSAPILFEESEEDDNNNNLSTDDDDDVDVDSIGLAVALPDDFIDPLPDISASSSGRQTPSTPTMPHLSLHPEKRQLPAHLRSDFDSSNHLSQDHSARNTGRGSPANDSMEHINTLVFIEPDVSRTPIDQNQNINGASSHSIASSLPSTGHLEATMGQSLVKDRHLLKQQMRKPARNLQDVKAVPFVFPPLKVGNLGNTTTDSTHSALQPKEKHSLSPEKNVNKHLNPRETPKLSSKSGVYVIPNRSQQGSWANPAALSTSSRLNEGSHGGRQQNWRKGHHRGGSWTSIDDTWDRDNQRRNGNGAGTGSGKWRSRLEDKEDGHVGLPPRVENKFRPRYRQTRRFPQNTNGSALPPVPPLPNYGFGMPRSRHQSRSGTAFDSGMSWNSTHVQINESELRKQVGKDTTSKEASHPNQHEVNNSQSSQPKYENSQLRTMGKSSLGSSSSRLAGQRNKSLVDLRAVADNTNQSWRQTMASGNHDSTSATNPMIKARSQAGKPEPSHRKNSQDLMASNSSSTKSKLADRHSSADTDNIYHPPHWHERNNSTSSSGSQRRPSNGNESDTQKQDSISPSSFHSNSGSISKGRTIGHNTMSSPTLDRKLGAQRPADIVSNWRGHEKSLAPNKKSGEINNAPPALTALKNSTASPLMTITPPTPGVSSKSSFISDDHDHRPESKKVANYGLMDLLRGNLAFNKNIKIGGEGSTAPAPDPQSSPERKQAT